MSTLILDGSNLLYRVYWRNNKLEGGQLVTTQGVDAGTAFSFLRCVKAYAKQFKASSIWIAWDRRIGGNVENFRSESTDGEYKGTRNAEQQKAVHAEEEALIPLLDALGVKNMYPHTLEADDVIAWLSRNLQGPNTIVSVDADMLQLINGENSIYNLNKKVLINERNFEEHTKGVPLNRFTIYKAILGDTSDNIEGFAGVGKVKAKKIALSPDWREYFSAEDQLRVEANLKLVDLTQGITFQPGEEESYKTQFKQLQNHAANFKHFEALCKQYEYKSILHSIEEWKSVFKPSTVVSILQNYFNNKSYGTSTR